MSVSSGRSEAEQAGDRHLHQLGRRAAPREEERGLRVLLRQRHRARHSRAAQVRTLPSTHASTLSFLRLLSVIFILLYSLLSALLYNWVNRVH